MPAHGHLAWALRSWSHSGQHPASAWWGNGALEGPCAHTLGNTSMWFPDLRSLRHLDFGNPRKQTSKVLSGPVLSQKSRRVASATDNMGRLTSLLLGPYKCIQYRPTVVCVEGGNLAQCRVPKVLQLSSLRGLGVVRDCSFNSGILLTVAKQIFDTIHSMFSLVLCQTLKPYKSQT